MSSTTRSDQPVNLGGPEFRAGSAECPTCYGSYRAMTLLGHGATSRVYQAQDSVTGAIVALKVASGRDVSEWIRGELTLLRRLNTRGHPGVVELLASGEEAGCAWYAMELLRAGIVNKKQEFEAREDACSVLRIVQNLAVALEFVHTNGVIHADVSPANVLFRSDVTPVLVDFGTAHASSQVEWDSPIADKWGTLGYTAPERLLGQAWDSRVDVYSLGCLWYELLTGTPVFVSDVASGVYYQHIHAAPVAPSQRGASIAPDLEEVLLRTLAKDPHARIPRAGDVADAIQLHVRASGYVSGARTARVFLPRLVGRSEAAKSMLNSECTSPDGSPIAVVLGDAGSGKTRLLAEASASARLNGTEVFRLYSQESKQSGVSGLGALSPAFEALCERLRGLPHLVEKYGSELKAIAAFHPELDRIFEAVPCQPAANDTVVKARLFRAVHCALRLAYPSARTILVLDDANECDSLTLEYLCWIAADPELGSSMSFWVGWTLNGGQGPRPPFASKLEVRLDALNWSETRRMLNDLLGGVSVDSSLVDRIVSWTKGNAFQITYVLRSLVERNFVVVEGQRAMLVEREALHVERWLATLLEQQTLDLDPATSRVGAIAAIIGHSATVGELEETMKLTTDAERDALRRALDVLVARRIVSRTLSGDYVFTHAIFRQGLELGLSAEERGEIHRSRAQLLNEAGRSKSALQSIGWHWARAGQPELAVPILHKAATMAIARWSFDEGIQLLQEAWLQLKVIARQRSDHTLAKSRLGLRLVGLYARVARYHELRALASEVLELQTSPLVRARVHRHVAASWRVQGDYLLASTHLDAAERELERLRSTSLARIREHVELHVARLTFLYMTREMDQARRVLRLALPAARRSGTRAQQAALYMAASNAIALQRSYRYSQKTVEYQNRARLLYLGLPKRETDATMALFDLAFMLLLGDKTQSGQANSLLETATHEAARLGDPVLECRVLTYRAIALRRLGQVVQCDDFARQSLAQARDCGIQGYVGAANACLAWVALKRDEPERVQEYTKHARTAWWRLERTPENRRREYPFQWLANLPLLSVQASKEDYPGCRETVAELLHPSQAMLPSALRRALLSLSETPVSNYWDSSSRCDAILRIASHLGYL